MPKKSMYQYVRATIFIEFHLLNVFLENQLVAQFEYKLPNLNQENLEELLLEISEHLNRIGILR